MEYDRQAADSERFAQERAGGSSLPTARLGIGTGTDFEQKVEDSGVTAGFIQPTQDNETGLPFFTLDVSALDGPDVLA